MTDATDDLIARLDAWRPTAVSYSDGEPILPLLVEAAALLREQQGEIAAYSEELETAQSDLFTQMNRIAILERENKRLREMLSDPPKREQECLTVNDWRDRALYLESQWSGCSRDCARIADRAAAAEAERDAAIKALKELVACKELKDMLDLDFRPEYLAQHSTELDELRVEYKQRKPLAWAAARAAIGGRGK